MKFDDRGLDVRNMQLALLEDGYLLPRFGADGHFGNETMSAIKEYTIDRSIAWTSEEVPTAALDALLANVRKPRIERIPKTEHADVRVYDLRFYPWSKRIRRKFKRVAGMPVIREPAMVTGITVHQTAAKYGIANYQVRAADGHRELALARRSLQVACHAMAFHDGFIAWANPLDWYVYHGNGFNAYELGLEIDGNYPGLIDGKTWNSKPRTIATDALIRAARAGIELLVREGRALGMPIKYIHAHRQSSSRRRSDPGEELWQRVVLEYATKELGLVTKPTETVGDGRPIPEEWDPDGVGPY